MPDFVTIAQAKQNKTGDIIFKVLSLGELKSGTTKKSVPYEKQDAVIRDSSGAMNLTLWNDDIGKLEAGLYYSLESAWWSEYKGEIQLSLGNYYELEQISESDFVNNSSHPNPPTIEQSATTPGTPPRLVGVDDKLDEILHIMDAIKMMVEPIFRKMVDDQLEDAKK